MDLKQRFIELAKECGRNSLYPYVVGNIKGIVMDSSWNSDQKIQEIKETLIYLNQVLNDDSLPWDNKKASAPTETVREDARLNCIMDLSKIEPLVEFPLIELGPMCNKCQCFKCNYLGTCHILLPSNLHSCRSVCKGYLAPMSNCEYAKENDQ
ncbi:hypothetical protein [Desulfosporosinus sp. SB140]|uniref:hypothetical protein n=1 Tax=Desulfosporosinus paludis TaxID=3115649 RepID=UPI00388E502F